MTDDVQKFYNDTKRENQVNLQDRYLTSLPALTEVVERFLWFLSLCVAAKLRHTSRGFLHIVFSCYPVHVSVIDVLFTANFTVNCGRLEGNVLTEQTYSIAMIVVLLEVY